MQYLITFLCLFVIVSCHKEDKLPGIHNTAEIEKYTRNFLDSSVTGEKLYTIENISYLYSNNKIYALVFYHSSNGHSNIVLEYNAESYEPPKIIKCEDGSCNCKVVTTVNDNGSVKYDCSCSSCTMIINN